VRAPPIVLLARRNMRLWSTPGGRQSMRRTCRPSAQRVAQYLSAHGASFFDENRAGRVLPQAEEALAELVALGLVNSRQRLAGLAAPCVFAAASPQTRHGGRRRGASRCSGWNAADAGREIRRASRRHRRC